MEWLKSFPGEEFYFEIDSHPDCPVIEREIHHQPQRLFSLANEETAKPSYQQRHPSVGMFFSASRNFFRISVKKEFFVENVTWECSNARRGKEV